MSKLRTRLEEPSPLLLDGGFGSMLLAQGLPPGRVPEAWNIEQPDIIREIHAAYVAVGSEAVHTNTFGGNPIRLAAFGLADKAVALNEAAVRLAQEANPRFVIGDVGPTGEYRPPVGNGDPAAWREAFRMQARALANAGVDGFHIETMSDLAEARAALEAICETAPHLPVFVSLTFARKRRGFFTVMGDLLVPSLAQLARDGAAAVGANCSIASPEMLDLTEEALKGSGPGAPLVVQPNAGQVHWTADGPRYDQSPEAFALDVARMVARGARLIGGCCGTVPQSIAALRQNLANSVT